MTEATLLTFFLQGAALGLTAAITPGTFQTYLIAESLSSGFRRSAPIAFAPLISDIPIIFFSLLILNQLPAYFLRAISLVGGLFALYLAWRIFSSWRSGTAVHIDDEQPEKGSLRRGVIANFLTPGPYLFWTLLSGPILLEAGRQSIGFAASFLFGFYGMMVSSLLGIALLISQARRLGSHVVRGMLLVSCIILVIFAGILITQGLLSR
ncbi:MAG: LysE family translocator [Anaerolineales bacterium]|jgi:threonine/homoserine/homoserine lactone efflux protein